MLYTTAVSSVENLIFGQKKFRGKTFCNKDHMEEFYINTCQMDYWGIFEMLLSK